MDKQPHPADPDPTMKIDCPECGARVLADDLELTSKMAKCRACNAVFSFAEAARSTLSTQAELARPRTRAPQPEGITVREESERAREPGYRDAPGASPSITLVRRWFTPHFVFLLFFCIAWDSFLVFWYANAAKGAGPFSLLMVIFPIAHVAVGVGLSYYTLAGFLNRTTFRLDQKAFSISHAPLPWKGNRRIPREEITQLYCEEVVTQAKNGPSSSYWLSAVLTGERKLRLASMPLDQARFLEERLEEKLALPDVAVPGEIPRLPG